MTPKPPMNASPIESNGDFVGKMNLDEARTFIEEIRERLRHTRGQLFWFREAHPGWGEITKDVEGALTLCIAQLYGLIPEPPSASPAKKGGE